MITDQSNPLAPPANDRDGGGETGNTPGSSGAIPRNITTFVTPRNRNKHGFASATALRNASPAERSKAFEEVKRATIAAATAATAAAALPTAAIATEGLLPDAPMDSQTKSAEELGIDVNNLIDSYYSMSLPFDAFELDPKTKFPKASLRSVVANFVAKTLLSFKEMGMYADVPQYDRNGILDPIKKASDLPKDAAELAVFAKDPRFNGNVRKIFFSMRFRSTIPLDDLKNQNSESYPTVKASYFRFLQERQYFLNAQQCASTRTIEQGWFKYSGPSDNINLVKAQIMAFWLDNNIAFDPELFQLSVRTAKVARPGTKNTTVFTAIYIACDASIQPAFRAACRLIAGSDRASEFPLIWNYVFIQKSKFMELGADHVYRCACNHAKWTRERFTFPIEKVSANVDPYSDAPHIDWGTAENPRVEATQSLATLILTQAVGKLDNGQDVFLFEKVQLPQGKEGTWFLQGAKETADQARSWIDMKLVGKLAAWYAHDENKVEGRLTAESIGPLVRRVLKTRGGAVPGTDTQRNGSAAEKYLAIMKQAAGATVSAPQSQQKRVTNASNSRRQRRRGTYSWADITNPTCAPTATDPTPAETFTHVTATSTASPVTTVSPLQTEPSVQLTELASKVERLVEENIKMRAEREQMQTTLENMLEQMVTVKLEEAKLSFEATVMRAVQTSAKATMEYTDSVITAKYDAIDAKLAQLLGNNAPRPQQQATPPPSAALALASLHTNLTDGNRKRPASPTHDDETDSNKCAAVEADGVAPAAPAAPPGGDDRLIQ